MNKWADYCVSGVEYIKSRRHIEKARVHVDKGDKIGSRETWLREDIISKINKGFNVITVYKGKNNGCWKRGEEIGIVEINGVKYLRTDKNEIEEDNWGNLPEV
ncbi:MAG: DUF3892 domain-containing protein [bacterium]